MVRRISLALGLFLLTGPQVLRTYLLMPFPGSQSLESIGILYRMQPVVWPLSAIGAAVALIALGTLRHDLRSRRTRIRIGGAVLIALALVAASIILSAPFLFRPPEAVTFSKGLSEDLPSETLVLGLVVGDTPVAYPIRILAYHHLVVDDQHGDTLLPTY